ncbi:hypothetical protein ACFQ2B_33440 [Streptomyces stramineus]
MRRTTGRTVQPTTSPHPAAPTTVTLRAAGRAAHAATAAQTAAAARAVSTNAPASRWLVTRSSRHMPPRAAARQMTATHTALPAARAATVQLSPHTSDSSRQTQAG